MYTGINFTFPFTPTLTQRFVFMQDNDRKHSSKLCQRYFKSKEEQYIFQLMSWPAQSADLNPIELVLEEFNQNIRAKQPKSAAHFWHLLQKSWAEQSSIYVQSLVKRILRICEAMIDTQEGQFDDTLWFNLYLIWLRKTCV